MLVKRLKVYVIPTSFNVRFFWMILNDILRYCYNLRRFPVNCARKHLQMNTEDRYTSTRAEKKHGKTINHVHHDALPALDSTAAVDIVPES